MPFACSENPAVFYHCSRTWTGIQQEKELGEEVPAALDPVVVYLPRLPTHPHYLLASLLAKPPQADEDRILDVEPHSIDRAHPTQTFNRRNPGHTPLPPSCLGILQP